MLKKMIYFSDGCGGQYENYKIFMNLMKHRDDFARNAEWKFLPHRMERMLVMAWGEGGGGYSNKRKANSYT